jgi:hypothetical protein
MSFGISKDDLIEGAVAAGIDKFSALTIELAADKIAAAESTTESQQKMKELAKSFFSNEKLGKGMLQLLMKTILEGVIAAQPSWGENYWVKKFLKEFSTAGMANCMTFTMNNIIDIGKGLVPTMLSLNLKEEAKKIKDQLIQAKKEKEEYSMDSI